jgi:hypothetical protein
MEKYVLKNSGNEAVIKVYASSSSGGTIDLALSELAEAGETVSSAEIKEMYWACKPNKSVDVHRVENGDLEGSYYLSGTGHWKYIDFIDATYKEYPFRFVFDGYGTVIIKVKKTVTI